MCAPFFSYTPFLTEAMPFKDHCLGWVVLPSPFLSLIFQGSFCLAHMVDILCLMVFGGHLCPTATFPLFSPMTFFLNFCCSPQKHAVECEVVHWVGVFFYLWER